jgi:hypothetical protein
MILRKPRPLIYAGAFCLAAIFGGREADALQVYPGCAAPPTTFRHTWYIDPVNGKTAAAGGAGTKAAPWSSLQAVFSAVSGCLLKTMPYVRDPTTNQFVPGPNAGPIEPGDEVLLMSGTYGAIAIGKPVRRANNLPDFVTIAGAPGQTPVLASLYIVGSSGFVFSGLKVQSLGSGRVPLVTIGDGGPASPTSNIVLNNLNVSAADPPVYATWT